MTGYPWEHIGSPDVDTNEYEYQQALATGLVVQPAEEENQ